MTTSLLVRLSSINLEPDFFVFFDRATDQLRWSSNTPRMPAVATMGGILVDCAGRVAPSGLARPRSMCCVTLAQITSHDPKKVQGCMRAESRSTIHEVNDLRSITDGWSSRSQAIRLMPGGQGFYLLRRLRLGGVSKTRLNSCTSRGGVRALSIKHVWERPGGQPLDTPFCTDVNLTRFALPRKVRAYAIGKATPPAQGRLYAANLSPPERR